MDSKKKKQTACLKRGSGFTIFERGPRGILKCNAKRFCVWPKQQMRHLVGKPEDVSKRGSNLVPNLEAWNVLKCGEYLETVEQLICTNIIAHREGGEQNKFVIWEIIVPN